MGFFLMNLICDWPQSPDSTHSNYGNKHVFFSPAVAQISLGKLAQLQKLDARIRV